MVAIGLWLAGLFGKKVTDNAAKDIALAAVLVLTLVALLAGRALYDRRVIQNHDLKQTAATAKADQKADNHVAEVRRADDARLAAEETQLNGVTDNAKLQTSLDRRLARQRCIRLQQSARASGRLAPACN